MEESSADCRTVPGGLAQLKLLRSHPCFGGAWGVPGARDTLLGASPGSLLALQAAGTWLCPQAWCWLAGADWHHTSEISCCCCCVPCPGESFAALSCQLCLGCCCCGASFLFFQVAVMPPASLWCPQLNSPSPPQPPGGAFLCFHPLELRTGEVFSQRSKQSCQCHTWSCSSSQIKQRVVELAWLLGQSSAVAHQGHLSAPPWQAAAPPAPGLRQGPAESQSCIN